jgi:hypothetical protein
MVTIDQLTHQGAVVIEERLKTLAVFEHFDAILSTAEERVCSLDFGRLGLASVDLASLDPCLSEHEVWSVIRALPPGKAPGPMGSHGASTNQHGLSSRGMLCKPLSGFGP